MSVKQYLMVGIAVALCMAAGSCSKIESEDMQEDYSIEAEDYPKDQAVLELGGGNHRFLLERSGQWALEPLESEWCIITPQQTGNSTKLDIFIKKNRSGRSRSVIFRISKSGTTYRYTIKQQLLGSDTEGFFEVTNNSAGELDKRLRDLTPYTDRIEKLRISGSVDDADCQTIKKLQGLITLDMEQTDIEKFPDGQFTAFSYITTLHLPKSLKSAGKAFYDGVHSSPIANVIVPGDSRLETIEDYAFYNCALESFDLPQGIRYIGKYAFYNCQKWSGLATIPAALTEIEDYAFYGCSHLRLDKIPDNITKIGQAAFAKSYLEIQTLPESLKIIGDSAFYESRIYSLSIPGSVEKIGASAFERSYLSQLVLGEGIRTLGKRAFAACSLRGSNPNSNLFSIPGSIEEIPDECFVASEYGRSSCHLQLNEGIRKIGIRAFAGTDIRMQTGLPSSLEEIGDEAFANCDYLYVKTAVSIPAAMRRIGDKAFYRCSEIAALDMSRAVSLNYIGNSSFEACGIAAQACTVIGDDVEIGDRAFYGCNFESIDLSGAVKVGISAFESCTKAQSLTLSPNIGYIGHQAFSGCNSIAGELALPSSLKFLGIAVFKGCKLLTSISLPPGITEISEELLSGCSGLRGDLKIPATVVSIKKSAFHGVGYDGQLILNEGLKNIEANAFYYGKFTGALVIPSSVETIGAGAFSECTAISELLIKPGKLKVLENWVFNRMLRVQGSEIVIPDNVEIIRTKAFQDFGGSVGGKRTLKLGSGMKKIEKDALECFYSPVSIECRAAIPPEVPENPFWWSISFNLRVPQANIPAYQKAVFWKDALSISALD